MQRLGIDFKMAKKIDCRLKKNKNSYKCVYGKEELKTDIDWFSGLGVEKKEAKSYIGHLLNKNKAKGLRL